MSAGQQLRRQVVSKYKISLIFWMIVFACSLPFVPQLFENVEVSYEAPAGTEAAKAQELIEEEFPDSQNSNHIVLIQMKDGSTVLNNVVSNFTAHFATKAINNEVIGPYILFENILGYFMLENSELDQIYPELKEQFVSSDQKTTYLLLNTGDEGNDELAQTLAEEFRFIIDKLSYPELNIILTGMAAMSLESSEGLRHDMERIDLIVIPLIIIALVLLLRNPRLVPIPLIGIFVTLMISFAIMGFIAESMIILNFIPNVMISIGLGVGVDYSLFLLSRFREERKQQAEVPEAIDQMLTHAGHTISVSGLTLAVAFFGLIVFPVPSLASVGIAITVTVLVSLGINLTFIPALLRLMGERLTPIKEKHATSELERTSKPSRSYWRTVARFSSRNAVPILILVGLIAIPVSIQALNMNQTLDTFEIAPEGYDSREGLQILREEFSPGITAPVSIIIQTDEGLEVWSEGYFNESQQLISSLLATQEVDPAGILSHTWMRGEPVPYDLVSGIISLFSLSEEERIAALASYPPDMQNAALLYLSLAPSYVSENGRSALIRVTLNVDPFSDAAREWIQNVRAEIIPAIEGLNHYAVGVAGATAASNDMLDRTYELFPFMILFVLITIALVVGLMYRSVFVPLRLLATILLTISWIYGLAVLFFEDHWGEAFRASISQNEGLFWMVPVMSFSILVGLGMDYDLFILGRIREEVWKGKTTREAIADSLQHTGGIVTGAAAIMVIAFGGLMFSSSMILVEFGFVLALAVLIDATVVRTFLVPAVMSLAERTNWWPASPPSLSVSTISSGTLRS